MTLTRITDRQVVETNALIVQRSPYSEADWVIALFTAKFGKVSAIAPGARKSRHRYSGGLEPFHTLSVHLRMNVRCDLLHILDASIDQPRLRLVESLKSMQAAGIGLSWLRRALPLSVPEPSTWILIQSWLDRLNADPPTNQLTLDTRLAEFGIHLLKALGWCPELERCVRCGKVCPDGASAHIDLKLGGILCRACGGMGAVIAPVLRASLISLYQDEMHVLCSDLGREALRIVEGSLEAHVGIE